MFYFISAAKSAALCLQCSVIVYIKKWGNNTFFLDFHFETECKVCTLRENFCLNNTGQVPNAAIYYKFFLYIFINKKINDISVVEK